ncbi:MAG: hypothetical protein HOQ32_04680 [Lysobacter sp.]|nr:hypothetical protein [Lysobacter sp.]
MNDRLALAAALAFALLLPTVAAATESVPEAAMVVRKATFKHAWPLPFDQATLTCRPRGYANTIATPQGVFALNQAATATGIPELKTMRLQPLHAADEAALTKFAAATDAVCVRRWSR